MLIPALGPVVLAQTAPTVSSVAVTSNPGSDGYYVEGDHVEATVTFSQAVTVTGTPELALNFGAFPVAYEAATYNRGSGTTILVFRYTVQEGARAQSRIAIAYNGLTLAGGTIKAGTTDAVLNTNGTFFDAAHKVDARIPALNDTSVRVSLDPSDPPSAESALYLGHTENLDANSIYREQKA